MFYVVQDDETPKRGPRFIVCPACFKRQDKRYIEQVGPLREIESFASIGAYDPTRNCSHAQEELKWVGEPVDKSGIPSLRARGETATGLLIAMTERG